MELNRWCLNKSLLFKEWNQTQFCGVPNINYFTTPNRPFTYQSSKLTFEPREILYILYEQISFSNIASMMKFGPALCRNLDYLFVEIYANFRPICGQFSLNL